MNDTAENNIEAAKEGETEQTEEDSAEWYAVYTFAKQEKEAARAIERFAEKHGYTDRIVDVLAPHQTQKEVEGSDTVERETPLFDGYLFVRANLNRELVHKIQGLSKITGFVGNDINDQPIPVSETEMSDVMEELERDEPTIDIEFDEGDTVRITEGAMDDMTGTVKEIDFQSNSLKVAVDMFGRETIAEVNFDQAEPID